MADVTTQAAAVAFDRIADLIVNGTRLAPADRTAELDRILADAEAAGVPARDGPIRPDLAPIAAWAVTTMGAR